MGNRKFTSVFEELNGYDTGSNGRRDSRDNRDGRRGNKDNYRNDAYDPKSVSQLRRELEKQERYLAATCNHLNRDGNLNVEVLADQKTVRCRACRSEYSFGIISDRDLREATFVVDSALQQMRAFTGNSQEDRDRAAYLGNTAYEIRQVPDLYGRLVESRSRDGRRRKKRNRNDDFASYRTATEMLNIR